MDKQNMAYIHTIEYYLATERNKVLKHATTWIRSIMLRERSQAQKATLLNDSIYIWIRFSRIGDSRDRQKAD